MSEEKEEKWVVPEHKIKEVTESYQVMSGLSDEIRKLERKRELASAVFWDKIHEYTHAPENINLSYNSEEHYVYEKKSLGDILKGKLGTSGFFGSGGIFGGNEDE